MTKYSKVPPRLERLFPSNPVFFVTVCTYRREERLANDMVHDAFVGFSQRAYEGYGIAVGRYVIMPDHVHLFVCGPNDFDLGRWMGVLKQYLEKAIRNPPATASPGRPRLQKKTPLWQRGFFNHVLRNEESYAQKWDYVRDNPVRAGFVQNADDWPYANEIITIGRV